MDVGSNRALSFRGALRSAFFAAVLAATASINAPALAQEVSAEDKAAARDLAMEGIGLAKDGKCQDAIPKLQRAEKLYHAPTILTWIGQCQVELGRLVEGTETLNRVVRERLDSGAPPAYFDAQKKASALLKEAKPKIAKLTIDISGPDGSLNDLEGLMVRVDESTLSAALVGAPRPTDPGTRTVAVEAPGYAPHEQAVTLEPGSRQSITILLEPEAGAVVAETPTEDAKEEPSPTPEKNRSRLIGWTLMGTGGAFLAAGTVTGVLALVNTNKLDCPDKSNCPTEEQDRLDSAKTQATLSTVFFGVGAAAVVASVVVLVTGKSNSRDVGALPHYEVGRLRLQPDLGWGQLRVRGTF